MKKTIHTIIIFVFFSVLACKHTESVEMNQLNVEYDKSNDITMIDTGYQHATHADDKGMKYLYMIVAACEGKSNIATVIRLFLLTPKTGYSTATTEVLFTADKSSKAFTANRMLDEPAEQFEITIQRGALRILHKADIVKVKIDNIEFTWPKENREFIKIFLDGIK